LPWVAVVLSGGGVLLPGNRWKLEIRSEGKALHKKNQWISFKLGRATLGG
jgi:hypothetical protein